MTEAATPFQPDWASPPGDTILDMLEDRGWTQLELAGRLDYTPKHVSQLMAGKVPLTEDAATRLGHVLGGSVSFWLTREAQYREQLAKLESNDRHAGWIDWLDQLPVRDLMAAGAITKRRLIKSEKPQVVQECLTFYGVASPQAWSAHYGGLEHQFRRGREDQSDLGAISAWLRLGEKQAEQHRLTPYNEAAFKHALVAARALTVEPPQAFVPRLCQLLADAGVTLILVPAIPGAHVSGVARWLDARRPVIQLSLYGKTNDKFWFTLFHEAAHILLHSREKRSVFLDDLNHAPSTSEQEREANAWARDRLIPPALAEDLPTVPKTRVGVVAAAARIGVHPGIVVGRMQYDKLIDQSWLNDLKLRLTFDDEVGP